MQSINEILQSKSENKTSNLSTENQVLAVEVWESLGKPKTKRHELPILFGLSKRNLELFKKAKQDLHAADKDGIVIRDRFSYFLWLIRHNNKKKYE